MITEYYSNGTPYMPFAAQMEELRKNYPTNKIDIQVIPDIDRQPNTYICQVTIWTNAEAANENNYVIRCSARRSQSELSSEETVNGEITAYDAVIVAALRKALTLMGYTIPYEESKNLQAEYLKKITEVASAPAEPETVSETPAVATPSTTETTESEPPKAETSVTPEPSDTEAPITVDTTTTEETTTPVDASSKPSRKKKEKATKPTENNDEKTEETVTKEAPVSTTTESEKVEHTVPASEKPVEKKTPAVASLASKPLTKADYEKQAGMTYEEALAMPCNHQSYTETMGELYDKYPQIFNWMLSSPFHAKTKKKEHAAALLISNIKKIS